MDAQLSKFDNFLKQKIAIINSELVVYFILIAQCFPDRILI